MPAQRRILLKLSGEALGGEGGRGVAVSHLSRLSKDLAAVCSQGLQLAMVVGGGNIVRGQELADCGVGRVVGDQMGMLATVINALAIQDALEAEGVPTRVMSAVAMGAFCEPFIRRRCLRHLEKGRVTILAGGTGNPYFTTDTAAALRAIEIGADTLMKATKVDGVYSGDPEKDPNAQRYDHLTFKDVLNQDLGVMDATAVTLCRENGLPIVVFRLWDEGAIKRVIDGEPVGTTIDDREPSASST